MASTGHRCEQSGIYAPACGCKQVAMSKGDVFPPCGKHGGTTYVLIQPTR